MKLGIVADDFTGATDIASMLVRGGLRTVQLIGVPGGGLDGGLGDGLDGALVGTFIGGLPTAAVDADAVVVALKSRTAPVADAVAESLAALQWLQAAGAERFILKVCSTFDSTPAGNIGPVAEAMMAQLGCAQTLVCPAFPENGRTVFRGHLFIGDALLSDTGMRQHPLTPMTDANLVRVMQVQSRLPVGLLRHDTVAAGAEAIRARLAALAAEGVAHVVADAIDNAALLQLAEGGAALPLWVAGSGLALGLPALLAATAGVALDSAAAQLDPVTGGAAVLAGSCSTATQGQVAHWIAAGRPALRIDANALARGEPLIEQALAWAAEQTQPPLVYATTDATQLAATQAALGAARAGALVEQALAEIARGLVRHGVQRLVIAGGETSGAVVQALGVQALRIGAAICPGVPWTQALAAPDRPPLPLTQPLTLHLALKSGNFGGPNFFAEALAAA